MTQDPLAHAPGDPQTPDNTLSSDDLRHLALQAGRGDETALTALIRTTSPTVWRVCAALVDPATADDLTQETYLRAIRSLPTYRGEAGPTPWLLTVARRVCADEIGRRQRSRRLIVALEGRHRFDQADPSAATDLTDAVNRLPDERREAFLLTAVAGLPYADAAAACGCPVGTIRSRVARARADLAATVTACEADDAGAAVGGNVRPPRPG